MKTKPNQEEAVPPVDEQAPRAKRVDAQRNLHSLLQAAMEVFAQSGVDAPVREIAERAGVGVGTVYRHFPQRADLIVAVLKSQIDACADAAAEFAEASANRAKRWRAGWTAMSISS
jgi:AcrR family transcriptional regulator